MEKLTLGDNKSISLKRPLDKVQQQMAMEHNIANYDIPWDSNAKILKKTTDNVIRSKKCNQCDYASSRAGHLRRHLMMHSGEKSNKCNQCDFASHMEGNLRTHLKHIVEKSHINATNVISHMLLHAIWIHI